MFFLLPIAIVVLLLEYDLRLVDNSYRFKKRNLEAHLAEMEVVVLGSSHDYKAFDPAYFSLKGFNLANASQSLYYDREILKKYLDQMPRLKLVVISLSYFTMGFQLSDYHEYWRCFFYENTYGIPLENPALRYNIRRLSYYLLYGTEESLSYVRNGFWKDLSKEISPRGAFIEALDPMAKHKKAIGQEQGRDRVLLHNSIFHLRHVEGNTCVLEELIRTIQSRGVAVVLLTTPVYRTYSEHMSPGIWKITQDVISRLSELYHIPYFNYLKDPRLSKEDFEDNDHLNVSGARKFSKIIEQELIQRIHRAPRISNGEKVSFIYTR